MSSRITFERPPEAPVAVRLTDRVGNVTETEVVVALALPGAEGGPPIRGVHASGYTWATPVLKDPILEMIAAGLINTVEIDLKDEAGEIWYDTGVPLAHTIGAVNELWDLAEVVDELHSLGVRVIGRLVVFRDPKLADHAVATGAMDLVVQTPEGGAYGQYGGFTNPFNREVWEYNIALAEEAARLGVDDILYDYVRRPDQFIETMRFPGQGDATPEDAIVGFLAESLERVHAAGARLGASVFGIAATRPDEVAQDIPRMATVVDYVAPMVYPSHWGPGEYGVPDPNSAPYDIAFRSLADFQTQVAGTGATVMAWLQDFSLGVDYGPAEVRAQIQAAEDAGVLDFLLWDAAATYTRDGPRALAPAVIGLGGCDGILGPGDGPSDDQEICPAFDGLGRGRHPGLIVRGRSARADAGSDPQAGRGRPGGRRPVPGPRKPPPRPPPPPPAGPDGPSACQRCPESRPTPGGFRRDWSTQSRPGSRSHCHGRPRPVPPPPP